MLPLSRFKQYRLFFHVLGIVTLALGGKLAAHYLGWEIISLNALFSGIVAANVFLMGFLLNGVIADYKESERLPGELAASIETLAEEMSAIYQTCNPPQPVTYRPYLYGFTEHLLDWFRKKYRTNDLLLELNGFTQYFITVEKQTQATFIARLKQEQANLRRTITRIHTIRETSFISSGYLVADITTILVLTGLILVRIDPFYESLFFVGVISFLLTFLIFLIRDLDNPFGYYQHGSSEDVSLKPLQDLLHRLRSAQPATPPAK